MKSCKIMISPAKYLLKSSHISKVWVLLNIWMSKSEGIHLVLQHCMCTNIINVYEITWKLQRYVLLLQGSHRIHQKRV